MRRWRYVQRALGRASRRGAAAALSARPLVFISGTSAEVFIHHGGKAVGRVLQPLDGLLKYHGISAVYGAFAGLEILRDVRQVLLGQLVSVLT